SAAGSWPGPSGTSAAAATARCGWASASSCPRTSPSTKPSATGSPKTTATGWSWSKPSSHPGQGGQDSEEDRHPEEPGDVPPAETQTPGQARTLLEKELAGQPLVWVERGEDLVHAPPVQAAHLVPPLTIHGPNLRPGSLGVEFGKPSFKDRPLGRVGGQLYCPGRRGPRFFGRAEFDQQLRPGRVEEVVAGQLARQRVDLDESLGRALHVPQGDGAVEAHDRCRQEPDERVIEEQDLRPVGGLPGPRFGVAGGDRGLELVRARTPHRPGLLEEPDGPGE